MADALVSAGFRVVSTDLKNRIDFLVTRPGPISRNAPTPSLPIRPYGIQGKTAEKFIEQALKLTKPCNGVVAMLLKIDLDSGSTRRRFFAECSCMGVQTRFAQAHPLV